MALDYRRLKGNQVVVFSPANVEGALTGVRRVEQDKTGTVTLVYTDGTKESAHLGEEYQLSAAAARAASFSESLANIFGVVSKVQSKARAALAVPTS